MGVCWQVCFRTLGIPFGLSVPGWRWGSLGLWSFLEQGIALGKTTETQAAIEFVMAGSYISPQGS